MQYIDRLRDGADAHFREWLPGLAAGDPNARVAAWGLRLDLGGLTTEEVFSRVAEAVDAYASRHRVLYAAAVAGGAYDDEDAIESALGIMAVTVAERSLPEAEREIRRRDRIVARIREGSYDDGDIAWLEERAAAMTNTEILQMVPFDEDWAHEISRHVARASTAQTDHWTRREIPARQRHLVLRETLRGRENETEHSEFAAYLDVVCQDGGASEFLEAYDEHVALAG